MTVSATAGTRQAGITAPRLTTATGYNAVILILTQPSSTVAATSGGTVSTYPTGITAKLYSGNTLVPSGVTYGGGGTQNALTVAVNASSGALTISGASWSTDQESFTITATYNSISYSATYTIVKAKAGVTGSVGDGARIAYTVTNSATAPTVPVAGTGDVVPVSPGSWTSTPLGSLTSGQYQYQSDGIYNSGTNAVTWRQPYLSSFKVGALSALTTETGTLDVTGTLTIGATGKLISSGNTGYGNSGIFLGYDSTDYKFSIGGGTADTRMTWDGATLTVPAARLSGAVPATVTGGNAGWLNSNVTYTTAGVFNNGSGNVTLSLPSISGTLASGQLGAIIDATKFAANIKPVETLATLPVSGNTEGRMVFLTTDKKLYRYDGTAGQFIKSTDGADIVANSITAGQIAAGAITATQIAASAITTDKLLVTGRGKALNGDPSFTDTSAWYKWSGSGSFALVDETSSPYGRKVLRATDDVRVDTQDLQLTAGVTYKVSLWARRTSGTGSMYVRLSCFNSSNSEIGFAITGISPVTSNFENISLSSTWTKYVGYTVTPAGTMRGTLHAYLNWATTGTTDISDFRCEEYIGADLIVDGAIVSAKIATGAVSANQIAANTITASRVAIVNKDDLSPDPGFRDFTWWGFGTDANFSATTGTGLYQPSRYVIITSGMVAARDYSAPQMPIEVGAKYRVQLRIFIQGTATGWVAFNIHQPDLDWYTPAPRQFRGDVDGGGFPLIDIASTSIPKDVWNTYTGTITATANTQGNFFNFRTRAYLPSGGIVAFAWEVVRAASADLIVDGAITAAKIETGLLSADNVLTRGLTVRDGSGNIILSAGTPLASTNITPSSGWLNSNVGGANLTDVGWWKQAASIPWSIHSGYNFMHTTATAGVTGPRGGSDVVWYCGNDTGSSAAGGGGWENAPITALDPAKTYRFVLPIQRIDGTATAYWGPYTACDLNTTTPNGNPYFASSNSLLTGRWYLFVGYLFPVGSTSNTSTGAGIYDTTTGALVAGGQNYNQRSGYTNPGHRAYQFYASLDAHQVFGRPMVNLVDGTEPSLREYFSANAVLNSALDSVIASAATTAIWTGVSGSGKPQDNATVGATSANLTVGLGTNLLANSDAAVAVAPWQISWVQDSGTDYVLGRNGAGTDWYPVGGSVVSLQRFGNAKTGIIDVGHIPYGVPVVAGKRYEASAYIGSHRCDTYILIVWYNSSGAYISESSATTPSRQSGGKTLAGYSRTYGFFTAPSGAASAEYRVRITPVDSGQSDGWLFFTQAFFGEANAGQTEVSPWTQAGFSAINQLGYTGDPNATYGATAATLNVNGSIAIAANSTGNIRMGQTAYNTGSGFWLGDVSGNAKFSIGNSATSKSLTYDTSTGLLKASNLEAQSLVVKNSSGTVILDASTAEYPWVTAATNYGGGIPFTRTSVSDTNRLTLRTIIGGPGITVSCTDDQLIRVSANSVEAQSIRLHADVSTTSTTAGNVSGLLLSLEANSTYRISGAIKIKTAANTTTAKLGFTTSNTYMDGFTTFLIPTDAGGLDAKVVNPTGNATTTATSSALSTTNVLATFDGIMKVGPSGTAANILNLVYAVGNSGTVTIGQDSMIRAEKITSVTTATSYSVNTAAGFLSSYTSTRTQKFGAFAGFTFSVKLDGSWEITRYAGNTGTGYTLTGNWSSPADSGAGALYQVLFEYTTNTGFANITNGAASYENLTTTRNFSADVEADQYLDPSVTDTITLTIKIKRIGTGTVTTLTNTSLGSNIAFAITANAI